MNHRNTDEAVRTATAHGVLTITLDRPKANAINVATSLLLHAAFRRLQQEPALRVAIITGTGRFFSAGWDLNAATEGEAGPRAQGMCCRPSGLQPARGRALRWSKARGLRHPEAVACADGPPMDGHGAATTAH